MTVLDQIPGGPQARNGFGNHFFFAFPFFLISFLSILFHPRAAYDFHRTFISFFSLCSPCSFPG